MKKQFALALISLTAFLATNAQSPTSPDSIPYKLKRNTVATSTKISAKDSKQGMTGYPYAIDNSEILLAVADSLTLAAIPENNEKFMYLPIIFDKYQIIPDMPEKAFNPTFESTADTNLKLEADTDWFEQMTWDVWFEKYHINRVITESPWLVPYNITMMPEPPKQYEVKPDVKKNILVIEERKINLQVDAPEAEIKHYNWIHSFDASLQFSQAYLSENWYQGGNSNLNMIANTLYVLKLNQALHPNKLFEFSAQYKLGINSAPDDELRDYSINEDQFQLNAKFGLKARDKFYYAVNAQFKTQLLQNFQTNTYNISASFLSPGEFNAGIGMMYSTSNKRKTFLLDASLSPLSYNMKICRAIHKLDPVSFGIDAGKHLGHEVGSSGECKVSWTIFPGISVSSRLFAFTNYSYVQGDLETTFNFSVNKFLSTQIYAHLRYDDSAEIDQSWRYWQFKEIISFGLQYQFRM